LEFKAKMAERKWWKKRKTGQQACSKSKDIDILQI
jgi:hypothetical protein